jgi:transcriptional regulator with XRE-family HTH domain
MESIVADWPNERSRRYWVDFAERLKLARHQLGISKAEAATALGITLRTYRKYERAERHRCDAFAMLDFCKSYDVDFEWFLGNEQARAAVSAAACQLIISTIGSRVRL